MACLSAGCVSISYVYPCDRGYKTLRSEWKLSFKTEGGHRPKEREEEQESLRKYTVSARETDVIGL